MRISISAIFKTITLSMVAVAVIGLGQGVTKADEVLIGGHTNGCFNCDSVISGDDPQTVTFGGLTYVNSTFSEMPEAGFLSLSGSAAAPTTQDQNNLGAFSLSGQFGALTGRVAEASQSVVGIPEPATMLLFGTGLAGLAATVRRRLARKSQLS